VHAKLQSNYHHQQTNTLTGRIPFLSPDQQYQSTEGEQKHYHILRTYIPKLTWESANLVLTTKGSWLPWGGLPSILSALRCHNLLAMTRVQAVM